MAKIVRNNFTSGEVSPALQYRDDLAVHASGLLKCTNMTVLPEGGVQSREGTQITHRLGDALTYQYVRIIPFKFSRDYSYALVFTPGKIEVMYQGAPVYFGGYPAAMTTTYSADDIKNLTYTQTLDALILAVEGKQVAAVLRISETEWRYTTALWKEKELLPVAFDTAVSLISVGRSASYTKSTRTLVVRGYTVSMAAHPVGARVAITRGLVTPGVVWDTTVVSVTTDGGDTLLTLKLLSQKGPDTNLSVTEAIYAESSTPTVVGTGGGTYLKDYFYRVTAILDNGDETPSTGTFSAPQTASLTTTYGLRLTWTPWAGTGEVLYYRVYKESSSATGVFGWIGDSNTTEFTDFNIAPLTSDSMSVGSLDAPAPAAAAMYQQRLLLAGGGTAPGQVVASRTGEVFSLKTSSPLKDTDAFTFNIASPQFERITAMVSLDRLYLFTTDGVWALGEGVDEVLTPFSFSIKRISNEGAARIPPIILGSRILYVSVKRDRLMLSRFGGAQGDTEAVDLTSTSRHLFQGKQIKEVVRQRESGDTFWVVLETGELYTLTFLEEHKIIAWAVCEIGGAPQIRSLTVSPEGGREAVYSVCLRSSGAYMERIAGSPDMGVIPPCLDAVSLSLLQGGDTVYGLEAHEGHPVHVLADGELLGPFTVVGGSVSLGQPTQIAATGALFSSEIETFPFETQELDLGRLLQITKVRAHISGPAFAEVTVSGDAGFFQARDVLDGYNVPTAPGVMDVDVPAGWRDTFSVHVKQRGAARLTLHSLEYRIEA